jgi:hypothetical protein
MAFILARLESSAFVPVRHLIIFVDAAPADNEGALQLRIVVVCHVCQTIRNYIGVIEWMQRSMMRHVEACINLTEEILKT